jgi:endonuclease-3
VVLNELGIAPAFPVDTHVFRLARRLGWSSGKDVEAVESDLCQIFPPAVWRNLHHWLILHGRRTCKAQRPLCSQCPLTEWCPAASQ